MAREKAASSISVKDFDSNTDDFDEWIELFEDSVVLATNPQTLARRHELYLQWLKQKLDAPARAVLKQIPAGTAYASAGDVKGVKEQLQELLIDPHAVYKWQAMKTKITWDQKESFQELATRVKRAVDKYDKDLDDASKKRAYFFRFREALPKVYRNGIDVACRKDERTLENAKEIALAVQMTQDEEGAALTGAAMADDRVHGLELDMAEVKTKRETWNLPRKLARSARPAKSVFSKVALSRLRPTHLMTQTAIIANIKSSAVGRSLNVAGTLAAMVIAAVVTVGVTWTDLIESAEVLTDTEIRTIAVTEIVMTSMIPPLHRVVGNAKTTVGRIVRRKSVRTKVPKLLRQMVKAAPRVRKIRSPRGGPNAPNAGASRQINGY